MSYRAAWLAWSLCAVSLALLVAATTLLYLHRPSSEGYPFWLLVSLAVGFAAYPTVGALVASRRPKNTVGWLLCVVGLAITSSIFTEEYASYAQQMKPDSLPGAEVAAYLSNINPGVFLAIFVPLLFPDGRLPTHHWRPVVWLLGAGIGVNVVGAPFEPGGADPLGGALPRSVYDALFILESGFFIVGIGGAVASVAFRLWHAEREERQQIKWLLYAVSVMVVGVMGAAILPSPSSDVFWVVTLLGFAAMPVAVGVAILRYRLYEIDLLINRTLVYGSLTATLVTLYVGGIVLLQRAFVVLTGEISTLAVVASTLLIAALFNPLRRRIQGFIDRRFYRRKYDARKTLEAFSAKLRDETDLEALNAELVGVVRETMQPAHVSLWLRPDRASEGEQLRVSRGHASSWPPHKPPLS